MRLTISAYLLCSAWLWAACAQPEPLAFQLPDGVPEGGFGACTYVNPFSRLEECKQYTGSAWTEALAREDCAAVFAGSPGTLDIGGVCSLSPATGVCLVGNGTPEEYYTLAGGDASLCDTLDAACTGFARGTFLPIPEGPCDSGEQGVPDLASNGGLQSEALDAMRSDDEVNVAPSCLDERCVAELAAANEAIVFTPLATNPSAGLVFYPGGGVDPRAYAVAAHAIAREGYLVAIVPMPDNLAVNGLDRAADVMAAHPTIARWTVAGHSLGGTAAATFVARNPTLAQGLAIWDSYPSDTDDLSEIPVKALALYGVMEGRETEAQLMRLRDQLPAETIFAPMRGANHSYFAWAGMLNGDVEAELINQMQQSQMVIGATLHLLRRVDAGEPDQIARGFDAASTMEAEQGCNALQQTIAGFAAESFQLSDIDVQIRDAFETFRSSNQSLPFVSTDSSPRVHVFQYTRQIANPVDIHAPPIVDGELFCKLRSQGGIVQDLGDAAPSVASGPKECGLHNQRVYAWALAQVDEETRAAASDWSLRLDADRVVDTGPVFMLGEASYVRVTPGDAPRSTVVQSPTYRGSLDVEVDGRGAGATYCKVMSYQNALLRVYARARRSSEPWTD